MKFVVPMFGKEFLLTEPQLKQVIQIVTGAQCIHQEYVGGTDPYKNILINADYKTLTVAVMDDVAHGSLECITKLHNEEKAAKKK